jgi:predicted metal-dependent HD superfamily phosphohydrolase
LIATPRPHFGADRFGALWQRLVASPPSPDAATVYGTLAAALGSPGRHYHTLAHIRECIECLDGIAAQVRDPDAVEAGLWFHDAILTPGAWDNERRSAELFVACAQGAEQALRVRVVRLILATAHGASALFDDRAWIVDIDLVGLAAPWDRFIHNGDLLRREAVAQSDDTFYRGQVAFLGGLLKRRSIYATAHFRLHHEAAARENLERLLRLRADAGYAPS